MSEEDIKRKQQFLRSEILEKGHDPEAFIEFLSELREGGDDIENWSSRSLEEVVRKYQDRSLDAQALEIHPDSQTQTHPQHPAPEQAVEAPVPTPAQTPQPGPGAPAQQQQQTPVVAVVLEESEEEAEPGGGSGVSPAGAPAQEYMSEQQRRRKELHTAALAAKKATIDFDVTRRCERLPESELTLQRTVRVVIPSSRQVKGGLFSASYTSYTVVTKPLGYRVERRYNDFFWLRSQLAREHPGLYVPPIPKKSEGRSFEQEFLSKRIETLEKFLGEVCEHPELRASACVAAFLRTEDEKRWAAQQAQLEQSLPRVSALKDAFGKKLFEGPQALKLEHFRSAAGEARSRISKELRDYALQTERLLKGSFPLYEGVELLCQELAADVDRAAATVARLCEQVRGLAQTHRGFNELVKEGRWSLTEQLYGILGDSLAGWGRHLRQSAESVRSHILCSFQYTMKEFDSVLELVAARNHAGQEYYRAAQALDAYKDKLLDSGDLVKWEVPFEALRMAPEDLLKSRLVAKHLMLPGQNRALEDMKTAFGYFNHAMVREVSFVAHSRAKRYIRSLGTFCSEQVESLEQQISTFNSLKNSLLQVYELLPEVSASK